MSKQLNWGILGTGNIARQFCNGVKASFRGRLAAVGSRLRETADGFAGQFGIPIAHGDYQSLLDDPSVQAVYVSLPNSMHQEWTIKALHAGKHVLCEKPFAIDVAQSQEMFDVAQKKGLLLMEAFMYRCHPLTLAVEQAVRSRSIGEIRLIRTSFCYCTKKIDGNVRFSPDLAGGVLMDVGCYCINFSRHFAQSEPVRINLSGHRHDQGVDDIVVGTMQFANGILASFTAGMSVQADNTAYICGADGYIEIPIPWKPPMSNATYTIARSTPPRMDLPKGAPVTPAQPPRQSFTVSGDMDLYGIEADDFAASVLDGVPLRLSRSDTLGNMRVLDEMRRMLG